MKQIFKKLLTVVALFTALFMFAVPAVSAQTRNDVCEGVAAAGGACNEGSGTTVNDVIGLAVNTLSIIVGVASVIMIIIGGFKYVTSAGDSSNVQSAKNTILYAIVGLVIVAMAQAITGFVLGRIN